MIDKPTLWRVQRPNKRDDTNTPWFCSEKDLVEIARKEANHVGNPCFGGCSVPAAKKYLEHLGFSVEEA